MDNPHKETPLKYYGTPPDSASAAVILLHGRRQEVDVAYELGKRINLENIAYAMPIAKDKTWYPHSFMSPIETNEPSLSHALECVNSVVDDLVDKGFLHSQIVFMGFSQGACLATEYVYRYPRQWGGLIAFTGGLFGPKGTAWKSNLLLERMPMLFGTSDTDSWVPLERVEETARLFRAAGAKVEQRIYPQMDHLVNDDEILAARSLLLEICSRHSKIEKQKFMEIPKPFKDRS